MIQTSFGKDEIIIAQGDVSRCMYEVLSGSVGVFADYQSPQERRLATFGPGETFGEMGVIEARPRSATVTALEDGTEVRIISIEEFDDYFRDRPVQAFLLLKQLSRRLRETNRSYAEACRTVSETLDAREQGTERSGALRQKLSFFADVYRSFARNTSKK